MHATFARRRCSALCGPLVEPGRHARTEPKAEFTCLLFIQTASHIHACARTCSLASIHNLHSPTQRFMEAKEAYETLSDEAARAAYDRANRFGRRMGFFQVRHRGVLARRRKQHVGAQPLTHDVHINMMY